MLALIHLSCAGGERGTLTLGIPTTVQDSGLLDELLPKFEASFPEYRVRFIAAGSGELLSLGARGDLDVLITHSPRDERSFMEAGHGVERRRLMENDFVIVGPASDPAGIAGMRDAPAALARIAEEDAAFFSRGDESGTHRKELQLRRAVGIPAGGTGYSEVGEGMASLLRVASQRRGYALSDRATFLNLRDRLELRILVEGDPRLRNIYSITLVTDARSPTVARAFMDWATSESGQRIIEGYGRERFGRSLYEAAGPGRTGASDTLQGDGARTSGPEPLPGDFPFLACVDVVPLGCAEQKSLDVATQEVASLFCADVEGVVIDQLHLALQPLIPTDLADALMDALTEFVRERRSFELGAALPTTYTLDIGHGRSSPLLASNVPVRHRDRRPVG